MKLLKKLRLLKINKYTKFCKGDIDKQCVLLEAGQGKDINGNIFALIKELCSNEQYQDYKIVFAVTNSKLEFAKKRFSDYGLNVQCVIRNSDEYKQYLATAKYLINDCMFPSYFVKRDEQVYFNLGQGTPIKKVGFANALNEANLANMQKNYIMSDYLLFPNKFAKNTIFDEYMLSNQYKGKIVFEDEARNQVLLNKLQAKALRSKLQLVDKKVYAYMPTWRNKGQKVETMDHKFQLKMFFQNIDQQLYDDEVLYVNIHYLMGAQLDYSKYQHIKPFPEEYETYEFLAICDGLISDYSNVIFDYAITKKKIILYTHDLQQYQADRGLICDLEQFPFPMVKDEATLIEELHSNQTIDEGAYEQFIKTYHPYKDVHVCENILNLLFKQEQKYITVEDVENTTKEQYLVFGGKLRNEQLNKLLVEYLRNLKQAHPDKQIVLAFNGKMHEAKYQVLTELNREVDYYAVVNKFEMRPIQKIMAALKIRFGYFDRKLSGRIRTAFNQERKRMYYHMEPAKVIYFAGNPHYMYRVLSTFDCEKEAHVQHNNVMGVLARRSTYYVMYHYFKENYDSIVEHRLDDVHYLWDEEAKQYYYNRCLNVGIIGKWLWKSKEKGRFHAFYFAYSILPFSIRNFKLKINDHLCDGSIRYGIHIGKAIYIGYLSLRVPKEELEDFNVKDIHLYFVDAKGYGYDRAIACRKGSFMKLARKCKKYVGRLLRCFYRSIYRFIPIDEKLVIFIAFHGRGYSDNPRAIYEELRRDPRFKDYRFIWFIKDHRRKNIKIEGAKIVEYFGLRYFFYMSRAKYWIINCKMPKYILKKDEQVYLQTWHGTPLKRLAHDIQASPDMKFYRSQVSFEAMARSYDRDVARYNYMISPNAFCTEVFQTSFRVDRDRLIETGYPRNDFICNVSAEEVQAIKQKYNIPLDKKVVLYAPTWRDNSFERKGYTFELQADFYKWKEMLGDDYVVVFKPHYLIINKHEHDERLKDFLISIPANNEINELYVVSDVLITDYSSVFFDYAILKRPIYFYMYDIEEYANDLRGFYLDIHKDLPGKIYTEEAALLQAVASEDYNCNDYERFYERFTSLEDGQASKRVVDIVFKKEA